MCVCVWQYVFHVLAWSVKLTMVRLLAWSAGDLFHINYCDSSGTKQHAFSLNQIHLSTKVLLKNLHPIAQNMPLLTRPATHTEITPRPSGLTFSQTLRDHGLTIAYLLMRGCWAPGPADRCTVLCGTNFKHPLIRDDEWDFLPRFHRLR